MTHPRPPQRANLEHHRARYGGSATYTYCLKLRPKRRRRRSFVYFTLLGVALAGLGAFGIPGAQRYAVPAGSPAGTETTLAMRPLEPDAPLPELLPDSQPAAPATGGSSSDSSYSAFDSVVYSRAFEEGSAPTVSVSAPLWLRTSSATRLWSSHLPDAQAFTDVPVGSLLRVQGPAANGRIPVYYVGDGLLRQPGNAWVEQSATEAIDPPPPGSVPEVDAFASRPLPTWVQAHKITSLWSGPDDKAVALTDLPQWSYLKVVGVERAGRLLVEYAGDHATRQPGIGWVEQANVGPSGNPGRWVQNHRASALWSGLDQKAVKFTELPQWTKLRLVEGAPPSPDRVLVEFFGDGAARQPGVAWITKADVGPITPPTPLPKAIVPQQTPAGRAETQAPRQVERRVFTSEADFVNAVGEAARRSQARTGVPASVAVAQAILESDWGRSRLARQANNLFGIKDHSGPGPAGVMYLPTWEHVDGKDVILEAGFKAYFALEESVDDHGRFFLRNKRYADAMRVAEDPKAFARAIQEAGYATDPGYAAKLIRLMDRYGLYRFDAR